MKKIIIMNIVSLLTSAMAFGASASSAELYKAKIKDLDSKTVEFSKYKGKTLLIVNTASGCGYTPQLKGMQNLAKKYDNSKFEVLGFPSNSFKQEELEGDKIKKFCFLQYGAKFTLFEKSDVKGDKINPIFNYLVKNSNNPKKSVSWNFEKFVVGPTGKILGRFKSSVKPNDKQILALIEKSIK